jgi:hypothetical protein
MTQQFASGLFFLLFGALYLWLGADLEMGSAADMGVGYTPRLLGFGTMVVGASLLAIGFSGKGNREPVTFAPGPLALTIAMVGGFAALLPWLGLPLTIVACVLPAAISGETFRFGRLVLFAVGLAVLTTLLFAWALKLQIPILPSIPGLSLGGVR